jgi:hypothetical protein
MLLTSQPLNVLRYESPVVDKTAPKVAKEDGKTYAMQKVGYNRWRFSESGVVALEWHYEYRDKSGRRSKKEDSIVTCSRTLIAKDVVANREAVADDAFLARLSPLQASAPGYGWLAQRTDTERHSVPASCCLCGELKHSKAIGHSISKAEWSTVELTDEDLWPLDDCHGSLQSMAIGRVVVCCGGCIPEGYLYCKHCRCIHEDWFTSRYLTQHMSWIRNALARDQNPVIVEEYKTGDWVKGGQKAVLRSERHLKERIEEAVECMGRASVCKIPEEAFQQQILEFGRRLNWLKSNL